MYCCCNFWVAFCCHPNLGWLGSGSATRAGGVSANSLHDGISRPAVTNDCWHARTASKHGAVPSAMCVIIVSAMVGCRSCTIRIQSAQLAQWAPSLERCALANRASRREGQSGDHPRQIWSCWCPQYCAHASPHVVIVVLCKRVSEVRADCSQLIRPCRHEEQEPRRLRVVQPRNPLE